MVKSKLKYAYELNWTPEQKITAIVQKVYGGKGIVLSTTAKEKLKLINKLGFNDLPVIIAKTQFSLSDNKNLLGAPKGFNVNVDDIDIRAGVGFLVARCGNMLLMPALGKHPVAEKMKIDKNHTIDGLF